MGRRSVGAWAVERSVEVVAFLLLLPLLTLIVWLHAHDRWMPVADLALTELHVRSVGTTHTPLVGLLGRLGRLQNASHPGPLGFYLLAPVYRLLGSSYFALRVSTATLNAAAIVSALLIARRRGGAGAVIAAGLGLAFLELGYGLLMLTEPWNPHLPLLWFSVFLLAVWSVLAGDFRLLSAAAVSGSICAQNHVPYIPMCGGLGLVAFGFVAVSIARKWQSLDERREPIRACLTAGAIVAVLWVPPILEQCLHEPGNFSLLVDYFGHPPMPAIGFRKALPLLLQHVDGFHIVVDCLALPGLFSVSMSEHGPEASRGFVFLVLWLASVALSVKQRDRRSLTLHAVAASSLALAWVAFSRIMGPIWIYLMFCGWAIGLLLLVALVSTVALQVWTRLPEGRSTAANTLAVLGLATISACAVRLAATVAQAGSSTPTASAQLAALAPEAIAAIRKGAGAATGERGTYLVTWSETLGLASGEGQGLVNALEGAGLHVGVSRAYGPMMTEHRVMDASNATAQIRVAQGSFIRDVRRTRGAVRIAYADLRTPEERDEFDRSRAGLQAALRALGRNDVADAVDWDLPAAGRVPGLHPFFQFVIARMSELGMPVAVFVLPIEKR
jgi:hypothetical protein